MKHMFIFSLLLTMVFLAISFANEEPENSRELPKEARMERLREIAEQAERSRAERLDGREVLVRVYNNWQENRSEFETVYIQLDGSTIMLDSDDIDESAFIVVVKEDQEDEVVRRSQGDYIYAESYKKGLRFKLPRGGSFPYDLTFKDALGNPLSQANVQIFLYAKELGKDSRIPVREVKLDESGFFKGPSINGSLNRFCLVISHPDNYGTVTVDPAALGFYKEIVIKRVDTIRVPWVSKETEAYERSIHGIVVDDANTPIVGAAVACNIVQPPSEVRVDSFGTGPYKVFTNEQGRFHLYLPIEDEGKMGKLIPTKSKYYVEIEAPRELGIVPFRGYIVNDAEHTIKMDDYGYHQTFTFEDKDGLITDANRLKEIYIVVYPYDKPLQMYRYNDWKDGGYFPLGTYEAKMLSAEEDFEFEPVEVTKDSPEELVFRAKFPEGILYHGIVVHGITGEPMEGAFVIAMNGTFSATYNFAMIPSQYWDALHRIKGTFPDDKDVFTKLSRYTDLPFVDFSKELLVQSDDIEISHNDLALGPILKMYSFKKGVRTDPDGRFEMSFEHGEGFHSFITFEKDYLAVKVSQAYLTADKDGSFKVPPIPLFPAAKVALEILMEKEMQEKQIRATPHIRIDANSFPEWAGKPHAMIEKEREQREKQQSFDAVSKKDSFDIGPSPAVILVSVLFQRFMVDSVSLFGIPIRIHRNYNHTWADSPAEIAPNDNAVFWDESFEMEPKDDPNMVRTFFEIFEDGDYFSFTNTKTVGSNEIQPIHVPAGLDFHLLLHVGVGWCPVVVDKTVNLKQGQTVDFGSYKMEKTMRAFVKVVDSRGGPVEGVPVSRWFSLDDIDWLTTDNTNQNGIVQFNMVPNTKGKFYVSTDKDGQVLKEEIPYRMEGEEDVGREYTITISDEMLHQLFK